ncbi:hypothetical protein L4D09_13175 [Photobacterium makurazakiensis]|uniref:hypothetical protein n=1 Tax=Photobacterium makurazakiensis TaxID=2910234 RepID=UPI003D0B619B
MQLKKLIIIVFLFYSQSSYSEVESSTQLSIKSETIDPSSVCGIGVTNASGPFKFNDESWPTSPYAELRFMGPGPSENLKIKSYDLSGFDDNTVASTDIKITLGPLNYSVSTYMNSGVTVKVNKNYHFRATLKTKNIWQESPGHKKITFVIQLRC